MTLPPEITATASGRSAPPLFPPSPLPQKIWLGLCIAYPAVVLISIAAANILLVGILLGWIFLRRHFELKYPRVLLVLVALYLAWTLIALIASPLAHNWATWFEERSVFLALLPGLILGSNLRWTQKAIFYVSALLPLLAAYAVYQYFFGWDVLRGEVLADQLSRFHATGLQDFHLTFAGLMALAMPVAAALPSSKVSRAGLIAAAGSLAVVCSMARAIMLGLMGCGALFLIFGSRRLRLTGLVIFLAMILLPSTIFSVSRERLARGLGVSKENIEQGDPTRIYLWKTAFRIIQHYPIAGVGEDNWNAVFDRYKEPFDAYSTTAHAHNDFLSAAVDHGLVGAALLLILWVYIMVKSIRGVIRAAVGERDLRLGFLAAFAILLFGGMLQNYQTDAEVALLLWCWVGLSFSLQRQETS